MPDNYSDPKPATGTIQRTSSYDLAADPHRILSAEQRAALKRRSDAAILAKLLPLLRTKWKFNLPDDTTPENFLERLFIVASNWREEDDDDEDDEDFGDPEGDELEAARQAEKTGAYRPIGGGPMQLSRTTKEQRAADDKRLAEWDRIGQS